MCMLFIQRVRESKGRVHKEPGRGGRGEGGGGKVMDGMRGGGEGQGHKKKSGGQRPPRFLLAKQFLPRWGHIHPYASP